MERNMENEMNVWFMRLLRLRFTLGGGGVCET